MIIAMFVMLVTSLLLVAAFTAANGDTQLSHIDLTQKQAYYAALPECRNTSTSSRPTPTTGSLPGTQRQSQGRRIRELRSDDAGGDSAPSTESTCSEANHPPTRSRR